MKFKQLDSFGLAALIASVVFILLPAVAAVFIWSVNTLAELGGAELYVEHSLFSYFVSIVFLAAIRGGSG